MQRDVFIVRAQSTDMLREVMRTMVPQRLLPVLHTSSFVAWKEMPALALSKDESAALAAWYQKHLSMQLEDFGGAVLRWPNDKAEDQGLTVWHLAEYDSEWFRPSDSSFMINYRVDNLYEMLAQLHAAGVTFVTGPEPLENGNFA